MTIDTEVLSVLEKIQCNGNQAVIVQRLDRPLYTRVNKVLENLGGKWDKKAKAHVFESDASSLMVDAVTTKNVVDQKKEFQFFETPPGLAYDLVSKVVPYHPRSVLEPSAGKGALVYEMTQQLDCPITAVEIQPKNCEKLRQYQGVSVHEGDFLKIRLPRDHSRFDAIVMNPPFTKGQDIEHVYHAWDLLAAGGVMVAITSPGWTFRSDRKYSEFKTFLEMNGAKTRELPAGTFRESGTEVRTMWIVMQKGPK